MSWRDEAACAGMDPDWFFPPKSGAAAGFIRRAKRICAVCPVARECLEECLRLPWNEDQVGVFGGMSANERQTERMRRNRRARVRLVTDDRTLRP